MDQQARDLAEQIANGEFQFYERAAVSRLRRGLPRTELEEDMQQEVRLHALVASHKFDPERGARFSTYLTTYLRSKVTDHLIAYHRPMRDPALVRPLEFDPKGDTSPGFYVELRELKSRLSQDSLDLLDSALEANTFDLRRKLSQGRATAALGALSGSSRAQVTRALEEIRLEAKRCLCSA